MRAGQAVKKAVNGGATGRIADSAAKLVRNGSFLGDLLNGATASSLFAGRSDATKCSGLS